MGKKVNSGSSVLKGTAGNDTIYGYGGNDVILGGKGNDYLDGSAGKDVVVGGKGDDNLHGGSDNDIVIGGSGADALRGDAGNDLLWGGRGADLVLGGEGIDLLVGGAGADRFIFRTISEIGKGGTLFTSDTILGFKSGADVIDLTRLHLDASSISLVNGLGKTVIQIDANHDHVIDAKLVVLAGHVSLDDILI